jgi:hypothetical protein
MPPCELNDPLAGRQPTRQVTAEQARESALRTLEERRERLDATLAQQSASLLPPATCLRCLHDAPPPAPTTSAVDLPPRPHISSAHARPSSSLTLTDAPVCRTT